MKRFTEKSKYVKYIIIAAEIIMLLSVVALFTRPLEKCEFQGTELETNGAIFLNEVNGMKQGYYIDSTMINEDSNLDEFVIGTPNLDLKRGSYQVKISYSTDANNNQYTVSSISDFNFVKMGRQSINLSSKEHECLFTFETDVPVKGYRVDVFFAGESYLFVNEISVLETNAYKVKHLILLLLTCFAISAIYFLHAKSAWFANKENRIVLFLLGIIIVLASTPTFVEYLFEGHDLEFHLNRIEGIKNALLAGQFPVRMHYSSLNGAGYPVSVFYGDLFLYIPALLRIAGWSVQAAYHCYIVLVNVAACIVMYFVLNSMFQDRWISICGTFLYMLAPYRLECIYLRAAVGEYTAMLFFPLVVYGIYRIYSDDIKEEKNNWLFLALAYFGIINCHIISTFIAVLLTALFCILNIRKTFTKKIFLRLTKAVLATLGMCLWFIIPFVDSMQMDVSVNHLESQGLFAGWALSLSQLLSVFPHGYGWMHSAAGELLHEKEMSYALGGGFILTIIIYVVCYIYFDKKGTDKEKVGKTAFFFSLLLLFMTTRYFPWDQMEQLGSLVLFVTQGIQFPCRFLGAATVLLTFVAAVAMDWIRTEGKTMLYYCVVAVLLTISFLSGMYFIENYMENSPKRYICDEQDVNNSTIGTGEYLPQGAPYGFDDEVLHDDEVQILAVERDKDTYLVDCSNFSDSIKVIEVPILYYNNYRAIDTVTGSRFQIDRGTDCRIKIQIPEHFSGIVAIEYCSPWYWRASEIISMFVILWMFYRVKLARINFIAKARGYTHRKTHK